MPNSKPQLGDLERVVMARLWEVEEGASLTVRAVHEALLADREAAGDPRPIAYTTVMTVLDRLARKDLVTQEREGRAFRYRARATRATMTAELLHDTLDDFAERDRATALVAFVEGADAEDLEALRGALAEIESAHARPKPEKGSR